MSSSPEPNAKTEAGDTSYEVIAEGLASTVSRIRIVSESGEAKCLVVKSASSRREFSREPHDIVKELRILSSLSHPNIIDVIDHEFDERGHILNIWMPFVQHSLSDILFSPLFSPHLQNQRDNSQAERTSQRFTSLCKSIIYQSLSAVAYLHSRGIAHRDIKPSNILLAETGCVRLIDFGISWEDGGRIDTHAEHDIWPERRDKMYFEVSTGPYRAPELLFGARSYDPFAIDLWSLGAMFAEFFTPLRLTRVKEDEYDSDEEEAETSDNENEPLKPFVITNPLYHTAGQAMKWRRETLFNAERGEISLAWSIFKIRGTPTEDTWPTFKELPDASGVTFISVPSINLAAVLPNLPPSSRADPVIVVDHFPAQEMSPTPLDLLYRFLVYPPERRLKAFAGLIHPWITDGGVLLPLELLNDVERQDSKASGLLGFISEVLSSPAKVEREE